MNDLSMYLKNFKAEFDRLSVDEFDDKVPSQQLMYLYAYYHYFNADSSKIDDIITGDVYSWDSSDKVFGVYIDEESDNGDVDALIAIYTEDNTFDLSLSLKSLKDAESAVINARERKKNARPQLLRLFAEDDYKIGVSKPLKVKIITNYTPKTASQKKIGN